MKKPYQVQVTIVEMSPAAETYYHSEAEWFAKDFVYKSIPQAIQALPRVVRFMQEFIDGEYEEEKLWKSRVLYAQIISKLNPPTRPNYDNNILYREEYDEVLDNGQLVILTTKKRFQRPEPVQDKEREVVTVSEGSKTTDIDFTAFTEVDEVN